MYPNSSTLYDCMDSLVKAHVGTPLKGWLDNSSLNCSYLCWLRKMFANIANNKIISFVLNIFNNFSLESNECWLGLRFVSLSIAIDPALIPDNNASPAMPDTSHKKVSSLRRPPSKNTGSMTRQIRYPPPSTKLLPPSWLAAALWHVCTEFWLVNTMQWYAIGWFPRFHPDQEHHGEEVGELTWSRQSQCQRWESQE